MLHKLSKKHLSIQKPFLVLNKIGLLLLIFFVILREYWKNQSLNGNLNFVLCVWHEKTETLQKLKLFLWLWGHLEKDYILNSNLNFVKTEMLQKLVLLKECWKMTAASMVIWILFYAYDIKKQKQKNRNM